MSADKIRLGHALRIPDCPSGRDLVEYAVDLATGTKELSPRDPVERGAVLEAEEVLGFTAGRRPIYAFVGDLHSELGHLGLVFDRAWASRQIASVSRCDSGGIMAGKGRFGSIPHTDRVRTLTELSSPSTCTPNAWPDEFRHEINRSYTSARAYVDGDKPDTSGWSCPRRGLIEGCGTATLDRRLWTWELQLLEPPTHSELVGVVLSPELAKHVDPDEQLSFPETIRVLRARGVGGGVRVRATHVFLEPHVRDELAGEAPR